MNYSSWIDDAWSDYITGFYESQYTRYEEREYEPTLEELKKYSSSTCNSIEVDMIDPNDLPF